MKLESVWFCCLKMVHTSGVGVTILVRKSETPSARVPICAWISWYLEMSSVVRERLPLPASGSMSIKNSSSGPSPAAQRWTSASATLAPVPPTPM